MQESIASFLGLCTQLFHVFIARASVLFGVEWCSLFNQFLHLVISYGPVSSHVEVE